jgi:cytochrome c-type biogenesis protein CcmE
MMARHKRMVLVLGILAGVGLAAWLGTQAFRSNVMFFFDPSQIVAGEVPPGERFRLGGMVAKGSVEKTAGTLEVHFLVTDFKHTVPVTYSGILPDLFRDGQGVVAHGRLKGGVFVADEILAKHDEKYMPPEVAASLKNNPPPPDQIPATGS